jgi:hypothetical protein
MCDNDLVVYMKSLAMKRRRRLDLDVLQSMAHRRINAREAEWASFVTVRSRFIKRGFGCDNSSAAGGFGSGLGVMSLTLPCDRALEAEYNLTRGTARRQFSCPLRSGSNYT